MKKAFRWFACTGICMWLTQASGMAAEPASAGEPKAGPEITHTSQNVFIRGQRTPIVAKVKDPDGVRQVRCYFQAESTPGKQYVGMFHVGGETYAALLPKATTGTAAMEYSITAEDKKGTPAKSTTYRLTGVEASEHKESDWMENKVKDRIGKEMRRQIKVWTEESTVPAEVPGFADDLVVAAPKQGMAATLTSKPVLYTAGGVAAIGVGAALAGGGGGGGGGTFDPSMAGTYNGTGTETVRFPCGTEESGSGPVTVVIESDGSVTFSSSLRSAGGTMNGNRFTLQAPVDGGSVTITGEVSGNTVSGSWSGSSTIDGLTAEIHGSYSASK